MFLLICYRITTSNSTFYNFVKKVDLYIFTKFNLKTYFYIKHIMTDSIPEEFTKVIKDFVMDIKSTFPEVSPLINKWWKDKSVFSNIEKEDEREKAYLEAESKSIMFLFKFCQKKFPPRFFEILYQNEELFKEDSALDTEFLPHIHFKNLWQFEISQKTRDTIWKYLQLILFSLVGSIDNREAFGDTAKLFEAINEDEFKSKLEETMEQMSGLFEKSESEKSESEKDSKPDSFPNLGKNMPSANDIHEHITGMLDGKLGKLAKEIAEETAANLNIEMENVTDMKSVFNNLIKNPTKLMGLVKSVGDKLDSRIKSGEIKESELMAEATEIMNKMKDMPGMENIQSMMSKMGLGGKMNMGAMKSQLDKNMKMAQMKERMKAKAESNKMAKETQNANATQNTVFSTGETVEKTPRGTKPEVSVNNNTNTNNKKKKKGKK